MHKIRDEELQPLLIELIQGYESSNLIVYWIFDILVFTQIEVCKLIVSRIK